MGKRDDFDNFFSDDDDTSVIDTRADGRLYRVPLGRLAANLVNPRTDFGTEDQLTDLGKSLARRQNQPCPVVSRTAYLKLWPDHDDRIGDVDYVLVSGERRYRAAIAVGLPALDCVANDSFAADRRTFMEAVVSENVDRQNFDPIEEAYAVQSLVREFGSNRAVAQHFERVDGWVTQRILLTHLAPALQQLVRSKDVPLEAARKLGKLARDNAWDGSQQAAWWQGEQDRRAAAAQARVAARQAVARPSQPSEPAPPVPEVPPARPDVPAPTASRESFTAVKPVPEPEAVRASPVPDPDPAEEPPPVRPVLPEPAAAAAVAPTAQDRATGRPLPYDDGHFLARHLIRKMPVEEFVTALRIMNQHAVEQGLNVLPEQAT